MSELILKPGIWLEIVKVRREGDLVWVQLKGDREDREPVWWPIKSTYDANLEVEQSSGAPDKVKAADAKAGELTRALFDGLDKNRLVLARLTVTPATAPKEPFLSCHEVRIQSADSGLR